MESLSNDIEAPVWFAWHENLRTDGYVILASLLEQPPTEELRAVLQNLAWVEAVPEKMASALTALRQAGRDTPLSVMREEFDRLFMGLGSGEMVPYASWYKEKKIQSRPLALLRADLFSLGIIRRAENRESEDHAGTLCEIMALLSQEEKGIPYEEQARFFHQHVGSWMGSFFRDLQKAKNAGFYQTVGLFGACFLETEKEYLQKGLPSSISILRREGWENEDGISRQPADLY